MRTTTRSGWRSSSAARRHRDGPCHPIRLMMTGLPFCWEVCDMHRLLYLYPQHLAGLHASSIGLGRPGQPRANRVRKILPRRAVPAQDTNFIHGKELARAPAAPQGPMYHSVFLFRSSRSSHTWRHGGHICLLRGGRRQLRTRSSSAEERCNMPQVQPLARCFSRSPCTNAYGASVLGCKRWTTPRRSRWV